MDDESYKTVQPIEHFWLKVAIFGFLLLAIIAVMGVLYHNSKTRCESHFENTGNIMKGCEQEMIQKLEERRKQDLQRSR